MLLNKQLPAFELTNLNGKTISSASLKGKLSVINFLENALRAMYWQDATIEQVEETNMVIK